MIMSNFRRILQSLSITPTKVLRTSTYRLISILVPAVLRYGTVRQPPRSESEQQNVWTVGRNISMQLFVNSSRVERSPDFPLLSEQNRSCHRRG